MGDTRTAEAGKGACIHRGGGGTSLNLQGGPSVYSGTACIRSSSCGGGKKSERLKAAKSLLERSSMTEQARIYDLTNLRVAVKKVYSSSV